MCTLVCLSQWMSAQSLISGDVVGTVTDSSSAVIANATVTLKSAASGQVRSVTTGQTGNYRFALLQPGVYNISVNAKGFTAQSKNVTVAVGQAPELNFTLSVGGSAEVVDVTSDAPILQVENGNTATSYSQAQVALLPNGGGDITQLAQLAPGSVMATGGGYGNFTSNGLPANSNVFTINGTNNMDPYFNVNNSGATNLTLGGNEIAEAAIVSNAFSGEYGQQAGAQVNYVTKSGTNSLHGDAKYLWTGRSLNARDYFNKSTDPQPFTNNNQWAVSAGGPIKKDKTFFFVNFEGLRYIMATSEDAYIPTADFASHVLSNIAAVSPDQLSVYQKMFDLYSKADGASRAVNLTGDDVGCGDLDVTSIGMTAGSPCLRSFRATPGQLSTEWILSGRVDHNITDFDRAYVRYRMDRGKQATYTDPISPIFNSTSSQPSYDGQVQWTHVFKNGATNQFVSGIDYYQAPFVSNAEGFQEFPYTVISYDSALSYAGGRQYGYPQGRNVTQYQFIDDFQTHKGKHTLKAGVNYRRYDITDGIFSRMVNSALILSYSTTDLVNGIADDFRLKFPSRTTQPIALYGLNFYGEDEWKASSNLKLTFALRFEHNSNPVCQTNCFSQLTDTWENTNHSSTIPYNQAIATGLHQAFRATDPIVVAPRFGFAWKPFSAKGTVIRGGFGLFYDAVPASLVDSFASNYPGFAYLSNTSGVSWAKGAAGNGWDAAAATNAALRNGYAAGQTMAQIKAAVTAAGSTFSTPTFTAAPDTMKTPRYQKWNLELQQEIGKNNSVTLSYSGNHGIFIAMPNAYANGYKSTGIAPFPTTIPDARLGIVTKYDSDGVSNYNGLTASFTRRMSAGLQVSLNYTWSHAFDTISNEGGTIYYSNDSLYYQLNPSSVKANYSNADYDVRHNFTANYLWTPKFDQWFGVPKWLGADWIYSGTIFARTGTPFTVTYNAVSVSKGTPTYLLPIYTGSNFSCGSDAVNTACLSDTDFSAVSSASGISSMRRNLFRAPGYVDADMSLQKGFSFRSWERGKFFVGVNAYNVFNHPNFATPASEVGGSLGTFGMINSTVSAPTSPFGSFSGASASGRIVQLNARVSF